MFGGWENRADKNREFCKHFLGLDLVRGSNEEDQEVLESFCGVVRERKKPWLELFAKSVGLVGRRRNRERQSLKLQVPTGGKSRESGYRVNHINPC